MIIARNEGKAKAVCKEFETISGIPSQYYLADFSKLEQVKLAAEQILKDLDSIHVLINSAGLHSTHRCLPDSGNELVFTVNHLATHLLPRMLIPKIKLSAPGRIIHVNSEVHRFNGLNMNDLT